MSVSPGWYKDPDGLPCERYWNGQLWTIETRPLINSHSDTSRNLSEPQQLSNGWKVAIVITLIAAAFVAYFGVSVGVFG